MKSFKKILNQLSRTLLLIYLLSDCFISTSYCADNSKKDTLALIGNKVITSEYFIELYKEKLAKIGLTDNGETRIGYLMNIVSDELLIAEAKNKGLHKTETALKEYKRIQTQELLNAYTTKHISPIVDVSENDLQILFAKLNTKIKVSHLYAATKEKADSLYAGLLSGKSFDVLARENFEDSHLRKNGGSLGYISVDEMDPDFEQAAYSMNVGEISQPVKTVQGYSIIRVEDIKSNPLLTENEFLKTKDRLTAFARKRKFEEASKQFSESLNIELNVKLNNTIVEKLFNELQEKQFQDYSESSSLILQKDLDTIAIFSKIGNWTLLRLIDEMSFISDKQKNFIRTKENLEDVIKGLVNRKYIVQKAIEEDLDSTPSFKKNVEFNFDTYLLTSIENEYKKSISIPPDSIKTYYSKNKNLFQTKPAVRLSSILVDNSSVADTIKYFLSNGIQFEELAKKYSIQSITAENGGDMGFFKEEELDNLSDEVFALKIGQWMGPIADFDKFVFLKCTDKIVPVTRTFEECEIEIEETLLSFKWYEAREEYVESLKNNINYKVFNEKVFQIKL